MIGSATGQDAQRTWSLRFHRGSRAEAAGGDCGVAAGEIGARQEIQPVSLSRLDSDLIPKQ